MSTLLFALINVRAGRMSPLISSLQSNPFHARDIGRGRFEAASYKRISKSQRHQRQLYHVLGDVVNTLIVELMPTKPFLAVLHRTRRTCAVLPIADRFLILMIEDPDDVSAPVP